MSLAARVKRSAKRVLRGKKGVLRTLGRLAPTGAVVLMYHSVERDPNAVADSIGEGISHAANLFERQMDLIAREFAPVGMDDLGQFLAGRKRLPRRAVAVTFDDGFRDNCEVAAPILARLGIRATIYVTAGWIESGRAPWFCRLRRAFAICSVSQWRDPRDGATWPLASAPKRERAMIAAMQRCGTLTGPAQEAWLTAIERDLKVGPAEELLSLMPTWEEVRSLRRQGHLIGSHTMSHPNVAHVSIDEARSELLESKRLLESQLGAAVEHFSYPCPVLTPHWTPTTETLTRELGYITAATTDTGPVRAGANAHLIPRVAAPMDMDEFSWALEVSLLGHRV